MLPTCPRGTTLLESYDECGFPCSAGYEPTSQDDLYCVGTVCSESSTVDVNDNVLCWKDFEAKVGTNCDTGTTEWTPGQCYVDCPPTFHDNGQSCIKPTLKRRTASLVCNYFFTLNGANCELSTTIIFSIALIIFLLFAFMFMSSFKSKNCVVSSPIQSIFA